jgi:hypothetical protein
MASPNFRDRALTSLLLSGLLVSQAWGSQTGYTMHAARVVDSRAVCANGRSRLLRVACEPAALADEPYLPGHVLALELADAGGTPRRGPYTVSRAGSDTIDVIYRVIDPALPVLADAPHAAARASERKTSLMAGAQPGDALAVGGRFKVPIWEGIARSGLACVFLISSGVGVGPQLGAVEQLRRELELGGDREAPPPLVRLFAGYREEGDVACAAELDALVSACGLDARTGALRFDWVACLSEGAEAAGDARAAQAGAARRARGRTTTAAPPLIRQAMRQADAPLSACHFHVIGRGSLVAEWSAALASVGVSEGRVSSEIYFGHRETHSDHAARSIAAALGGT